MDLVEKLRFPDGIGLPEYALLGGSALLVALAPVSPVGPKVLGVDYPTMLFWVLLFGSSLTVSADNARTVVWWCVVVGVVTLPLAIGVFAAFPGEGATVPKDLAVAPIVTGVFVAGAMGLVALPRHWLSSERDRFRFSDGVGAPEVVLALGWASVAAFVPADTAAPDSAAVGNLALVGILGLLGGALFVSGANARTAFAWAAVTFVPSIVLTAVVAAGAPAATGSETSELLTAVVAAPGVASIFLGAAVVVISLPKSYLLSGDGSDAGPPRDARGPGDPGPRPPHDGGRPPTSDSGRPRDRTAGMADRRDRGEEPVTSDRRSEDRYGRGR